jgi:ABC-type sugar transport system ATPase subunit
LTAAPRLRAQGIWKAFPGVQALQDVDLELHAGTVVALAGENGAGKSTLIKILAGLYAADRGTIEIDGSPLELRQVSDATAAGIAVIHQELELAENLSVAENLFLGRLPTRGRFGLRDNSELERLSLTALDRVDLDLDLQTPVAELALGHKQLLEIARALSQEAAVLILDEPTSSLSAAEAQTLFSCLDELREDGLAVLYITHRINEIERLADRVEVLRDGRNAGSLEHHEIEREAVIRIMVGRDLVSGHAPATPAGAPAAPADGRIALEVSDLRPAGASSAVSFDLGRGEILGFGGLVGSGRSAVVRAIFGLDPIESGVVRVDGRTLAIHSPRDAIAAGIALVPEDRKLEGLVLELTACDNLTLAHRSRLGRWGLRNRSRELRSAAEQQRRLDIRAPDLDAEAATLSGGNQQKLVVGKWLAAGGSIFLLDEPTRGVDVGARQEIYALLHELTEQGASIVMVSSDSEELLAMSDRILVFREGAVVGELTGEDRREESILRLALGGSSLNGRAA